MDIQKEIDAKLAACAAEIENRKGDLTLVLHNMEAEAKGRVAESKAEAQKYASQAAESRKEVEHLSESRKRIETDIATLRLTLPELRTEMGLIKEQGQANQAEHQARLTTLRASIAEDTAKLEAVRQAKADMAGEIDEMKASYHVAISALLADVENLSGSKVRLDAEVTRLLKDTGVKTAELNDVISSCVKAQRCFNDLLSERGVLEAKLSELTAKSSQLELSLAAQVAALTDVEKERKRVSVYESMVSERELAIKADAARLNALKESLNKKEKDLAALGLQVK